MSDNTPFVKDSDQNSEQRLYRKIGTRINGALAFRKISQKQLAQELGVRPNTVSYWCSGSRHPNYQQILEISKFLDVPTDYLFGISDSPSQDKSIQTACSVTGLKDYAVLLLQAWRGLGILSDGTLAFSDDELSDTGVYYLDILSSIIAGKAFPHLLHLLAKLKNHSEALRAHMTVFSLLGPEEGNAVSALAQGIYDSVRLDRLEIGDQFTRLLDEIVGLDKLIRDYDSMQEEVRKSHSEKHEDESEPEG